MDKEKYIGSSKLLKKPDKSIKMVLKPIGWEKLSHSLQNIILSINAGSTIPLSSDFGESENLTVTQKKITEAYNELLSLIQEGNTSTHDILPFDGFVTILNRNAISNQKYTSSSQVVANEYIIVAERTLNAAEKFYLKVEDTYYTNWEITTEIPITPVVGGDPLTTPESGVVSKSEWYYTEYRANKLFYNRSNRVVYCYNYATSSLAPITNIQVVEENAPEAESTSNPNNSAKGSIVVDLEHDKMLTWDGNKWKALSGGGSVDITDLPNTLAIENGVLYLKNVKDGVSTNISQVQLPVPEDGKSAYELALENNSTIGTEEEWLASLKGTDGINGTDGEDGEDGKSAFQIWKEENNKPNASVREFLASLKESNFTSVAVQSLPTTDIDTNKIYCLPDSVNNTWTEYISDGTNWIALITHTGDLEVHSDVVDVDGLGTTLTEAIVGKNIVPEEEQTQAYYTDFERTNDYAIGNDGKAYSLTGKAISEYIEVCPGTAYTCKSAVWNKDSNIGLAFYTDNNEDSYIEGSFRNDTIYDIANVSGTVPSNAKYIRVTWPKVASGFYPIQNYLLYYKPTKEYYSKIEQAGSFKTGEKVGDVEIDDTLQKDSEGLIKSGAVYEVTHAQIINRYDTPLLTGTIATSYKSYTISAGKTVYDKEINIVKLIFNENIKDSATDITVTYYIADPDTSTLGTSHTATIVAGTNYAEVDFMLPAGKLIYVKNQDVFASGDSYPSGCLIAGNRSSGSEQSYYVFGSTHGNIYAGFSYEYSRSVELKEYVDRLNEETDDKIEELSKNSVYSVTWKDAKTVVVFGSSLTDQRYAPAGHIWLEEINHICNVNLINYALSGEALQGANLRWAKELDFSPTWILWNNEANGTPYGLAGYKLLCAAMEITQSKGAIMMLGGENHTANEDNYPLKRVDKLFDVFAEEHHLCRSELRRERVLSLVGQTYPRFDGGIHYGWRNQAPFITKHLELLGNLPVSKSVKIYKVRPKSANLQISALSYDTPLQRMKHFYALSTGVAYNGLYTTSQFDVVDNIKQGQNDNPQPYYANTLEPVDIIKTRETEALLKGNDITIPNGKAVVEFTLEHTDVKSGIFKFKTSANSLQIYVAIAYNSSTTYDDNPRSTWQLVNDVTISSDDNSGYIVTVNVAGVIELYDNVKFLVVASGEFTIKQPEFEYEGGMKKNTPVLNYKPRKYGVEVNDNLHVDENDWTLTGNAVIGQVPSSIGLYAANTYHIELSSQNDSASKTVTIPAGTKRVAIRVMAQRFVKIMTKLFAGTPDANSPYVSETQVINNYDCDLGVVDIIINDAAVSHHVVCPGFSWNYIEFAPDLTDTSLKIEVRKPDDDTAPIMVYMLSVQVIESEYLNTIKGIQTSISSVEQRLDSIEQANTGQ